MPFLALRLTAHDRLTEKQKRAMVVVAEFVDLGTGASYETSDPHDWWVHADTRFDLPAAALLACAFKWPERMPDVEGLSRSEIRAAMMAEYDWEVPEIPEGEDPPIGGKHEYEPEPCSEVPRCGDDSDPVVVVRDVPGDRVDE